MTRKASLLAALSIALVVLAVAAGVIRQPASAKTPAVPLAPQAGTVTVAGGMGSDQLQPIFDEYTNRTGTVVTYLDGWGIDEFSNCDASGTCPDVGFVPQPGLMQDLATAGALAELTPFIDTTVLNANYTDTWIDLGEVEGTLYGVWFNAQNKSLIWYDPAEFSSHGWMTPTNWTELLTLSDDILSATGTPPWSIGAESGDATGWPITDWFEDILLRSAGPEVYDQLITHDIPWTDSEVLSAMTYFGDILGNEDYQLGGKSGTLSTWFGEAILPPFRDPPEAYLHRQGSFASQFIKSEFPTQTPGINYAVSAFPDIEPAYANAVMGAGDLTVVFNATAEAQDLINFLITTDAAEIWIGGGNVSPNRGVDFNLYTDPILRTAAEQMANADIFRFDLSDQLPSELNLFMWSQMDDLVRAAPDPDAMQAVLARIEMVASGADLVTVAGGMGSGQLQPVFDEFANQTGDVVTYLEGWGVEEFSNCEDNENCPDVGFVPRPGLMQDLATAGVLEDLTPFIDTMVLSGNYADTWIDQGKVDDTLYGVWFNATNKSLVWYDPIEFSNSGWMTPTTWAELLTLSDDILNATGTPPWSIGAESGAATGWPITDWFEDILLRSAGPEIYDQLIAHDIPWTHPDVLSAMTYFGDIFGNEAYQLGGKSGTLSTWFGDAVMPPFTDPPEAYLHRQGSFAANWIDPSQVPGADYAVSAFPDIEPAYANAVMGTGELAVVFSATTEAQDLINFLITTDAAEIWIEGGNSSPNRGVDFNLYTDPILRTAAEQMANADIFRFDLSDQLPDELNRFMWSQMDDLVWAAPDPDAMQAVLTRIEIHASGANFVYLPIVVRGY